MKDYTLIQYGGYNLSNNRCITSSASGSRDYLVPLQRLPNSRFAGSTPVNRRLNEREILLTGSINSAGSDFQDVLTDFKMALYKENRKLHIAPLWTEIVEPENDSDWLFMGDAISKDFDTQEYQFGIGSIAFTANTYASGYARLRNYDLAGVNLGEYQNQGNFEFWLYIPDKNIVTDISLSIGSDDSNLGYAIVDPFTANYDGKPLENGWNYISIAWGDLIQVGNPDPYSMGRFVDVVVEYSSLPESQTFLFGGLLWQYDDDTKNYAGYFENIVIGTQHFDINRADFNARFINYDGVAVGSSDLNAFTQTGISTDSYSFDVELGGNYDPEPKIYILTNSVTNLESITIENTTTGDSVVISDTFVAGAYVIMNLETKEVTIDGSVVGYSDVLPRFEIGKNNIKITLVSSSASSISQTTINSDLGGEI